MKSRESFVQRMETMIQSYPALLHLSVFRRAQRLAHEGAALSELVSVLMVDLDKFMYGDTEEFGRYVLHLSHCLGAASTFQTFNQTINDGRGSNVLRYLIQDLNCGDLDTARTTYSNEGDKVQQYEGVGQAIKNSIVGCRMHATPYCGSCTE